MDDDFENHSWIDVMHVDDVVAHLDGVKRAEAVA